MTGRERVRSRVDQGRLVPLVRGPSSGPQPPDGRREGQESGGGQRWRLQSAVDGWRHLLSAADAADVGAADVGASDVDAVAAVEAAAAVDTAVAVGSVDIDTVVAADDSVEADTVSAAAAAAAAEATPAAPPSPCLRPAPPHL